MKWLSSQDFGIGATMMFLIILGILVFAALSGMFFISHWKYGDKKDPLYDETDSFDQQKFKRWRL